MQEELGLIGTIISPITTTAAAMTAFVMIATTITIVTEQQSPQESTEPRSE